MKDSSRILYLSTSSEKNLRPTFVVLKNGMISAGSEFDPGIMTSWEMNSVMLSGQVAQEVWNSANESRYWMTSCPDVKPSMRMFTRPHPQNGTCARLVWESLIQLDYTTCSLPRIILSLTSTSEMKLATKTVSETYKQLEIGLQLMPSSVSLAGVSISTTHTKET